MRDKVVTASEAVAIIRPGDTIATSGFVGIGTPDASLLEFPHTGHLPPLTAQDQIQPIARFLEQTHT